MKTKKTRFMLLVPTEFIARPPLVEFSRLNGVIARLGYWFRAIAVGSLDSMENGVDISNTHNLIELHFERLSSPIARAKSRSMGFRKRQLKSLLNFLRECEEDICQALYSDLKKPRFEALTSEIGVIRSEIQHALKGINQWAKIEYVKAPLAQFPASCAFVHEPKGLVLIIAPWNFPIQLALAPLIGAIAAGNTIILKPSELAPNTSQLLATKLTQYLDPNCIQVIEGDQHTSKMLLGMKFDHIFFTGSTAVGRIVMQEAARNLIPVTLELGGKSPCLIDDSADLKVAANRIAWGKLINCGQVCLAPDFALVQKSILTPFLAALKEAIREKYGAEPKASPRDGRIISKRHTLRLKSLLEKQPLILGGEIDLDQNYVAPTLVLNPKLDSALMQEEIFGPILPLIEFNDFDEAVQIVSRGEKPLAIYLFSKIRSHTEQLRLNTASGAICINDTISHIAVPNLPFGGTGLSGMGTYHGEESFKAFSYKRVLFKKSTLFDLPLRYPPYSALKERIAGWFMR